MSNTNAAIGPTGGQFAAPTLNQQILVFVFAFLALTIDGTDMMFLSYALTSLKKDFALDNFQAGTLASFTLAGMALGGIFSGWACDRYGRVRTITWGIAIFSVFTALLGFTQGYWQFAILRFLGSLGLGAVYSSSFILMSEYMPARYRATILGSAMTGYTAGFILAAFLSGQIIPHHGWRPLFYIAIFPVVVCLFLRRLIPEPAAWVAARAKQQADASQAAGKKERSGFAELFQEPRTRMIFILWMIIAFFLMFGYYGVSNWVPAYLEKELSMNFKSMTNYMIGSYLAMFLGKIVAGIAGDLLGRRVVYCLGALATTGFLYVLLQYQTPENIIYMLTGFGFVYGLTIGVMSTYITESFATKIRGLAVGASYNIGRIGGAIAPATIGLIADRWSVGLGLFSVCAAYLITGLVAGIFIRDRMYDPQREG
jgi:AAHS family cis,cis-muconate transporter-like MFS transporter